MTDFDSTLSKMKPEQKRRFVAEKIMEWHLGEDADWLDVNDKETGFCLWHASWTPEEMFKHEWLPDENLQQLHDNVEKKAMEEIKEDYINVLIKHFSSAIENRVSSDEDYHVHCSETKVFANIAHLTASTKLDLLIKAFFQAGKLSLDDLKGYL